MPKDLSTDEEMLQRNKTRFRMTFLGSGALSLRRKAFKGVRMGKSK